jgi:hypothetical protein
MVMPEFGGSSLGRQGLEVALEEWTNWGTTSRDSGEWEEARVDAYLNSHAPAGASWCAAFVSWCFREISDQIPFQYDVNARNTFLQFDKKGWAHHAHSGYEPSPGDLAVWWRGHCRGLYGHIGFVHHFENGTLHTIEGNVGGRLVGGVYNARKPLSLSMPQLLGFCHIPQSTRPKYFDLGAMNGWSRRVIY